METFPNPEEPKKEDPFSSIKKSTLVAGALLAGTAQGTAQVHSPDVALSTITIQENPQLERENNKIVEHVNTIENALKAFAKKIDRGDKTVIAILSESEALSQYKYHGDNDWETIATQGATIDLATNESRTYTIKSRDRKSINALLQERDLVTDPETGKNKSKILSKYTPVDYYFIIGAEEINDDSVRVRVRKVDMHTKKVVTHEKEIGFKASKEWKHEWKRLGEIDVITKTMVDDMLQQ